MSALTDFIDRIIQRFPPSFRWDDAQKNSWTEDMVRELGGFSAEVLTRAWQHMVRTRTKKETPLVSECIGACIDAKKWIEAEANAGKLPIASISDPFVKDWREDDFANNIALNRNDPLCVQAAKEGWIGVLHTFVRKHRRMPKQTERIAYRKSMKAPEQMVSEIDWCKREAKDFDEAYAKCVRGGFPQAAGFIENLGDPMLKRREELADRVLHGVIG